MKKVVLFILMLFVAQHYFLHAETRKVQILKEISYEEAYDKSVVTTDEKWLCYSSELLNILEVRDAKAFLVDFPIYRLGEAEQDTYEPVSDVRYLLNQFEKETGCKAVVVWNDYIFGCLKVFYYNLETKQYEVLEWGY